MDDIGRSFDRVAVQNVGRIALLSFETPFLISGCVIEGISHFGRPGLVLLIEESVEGCEF